MIFLTLLIFFQENLIPEKFKEPSGLTYSEKRKTIFVVGDEGHIAELDKDGKLIKMKKMPGDSCERDFEAVSIDPRNNNLLIMREPLWEIISVNPESFEIEFTYKLPGAPSSCKDEDWGLEALTVIGNDEGKDGWLKVLAGKQRYPAAIYEFSIPLEGNEDPILNKEHKLKIESISDLYYEKETNNLWILDSWLIQRMLTAGGFHGRLFLFKDYKKIKTWHLPFPLSEGISFTPSGDLWVADDTGGIYLFKKWKEKNLNF
tara:strand:- start:4278 stop:5057 length:780 start_codon:yes stop_codon:yes gene_type:complete